MTIVNRLLCIPNTSKAWIELIEKDIYTCKKLISYLTFEKLSKNNPKNICPNSRGANGPFIEGEGAGAGWKPKRTEQSILKE